MPLDGFDETLLVFQCLDDAISCTTYDAKPSSRILHGLMMHRIRAKLGPPKNLKPQPLLWQSLVQESAVPIRQRDSSIPARIASVIDHALIEKPEIGCKSAAAFRRDIIAALPPETRAYCKGIL